MGRPRLLSDDDITDVRALYSDGIDPKTGGHWTMAALGKLFGVNYSTIRNALLPTQVRSGGPPPVLSNKEKAEMIRLREQDPKKWSFRKLADHFGISVALAWRIVDRGW